MSKNAGLKINQSKEQALELSTESFSAVEESRQLEPVASIPESIEKTETTTVISGQSDRLTPVSTADIDYPAESPSKAFEQAFSTEQNERLSESQGLAQKHEDMRHHFIEGAPVPLIQSNANNSAGVDAAQIFEQDQIASGSKRNKKKAAYERGSRIESLIEAIKERISPEAVETLTQAVKQLGEAHEGNALLVSATELLNDQRELLKMLDGRVGILTLANGDLASFGELEGALKMLFDEQCGDQLSQKERSHLASIFAEALLIQNLEREVLDLASQNFQKSNKAGAQQENAEAAIGEQIEEQLKQDILKISERYNELLAHNSQLGEFVARSYISQLEQAEQAKRELMQDLGERADALGRKLAISRLSTQIETPAKQVKDFFEQSQKHFENYPGLEESLRRRVEAVAHDYQAAAAKSYQEIESQVNRASQELRKPNPNIEDILQACLSNPGQVSLVLELYQELHQESLLDRLAQYARSSRHQSLVQALRQGDTIALQVERLRDAFDAKDFENEHPVGALYRSFQADQIQEIERRFSERYGPIDRLLREKLQYEDDRLRVLSYRLQDTELLRLINENYSSGFWGHYSAEHIIDYLRGVSPEQRVLFKQGFESVNGKSLREYLTVNRGEERQTTEAQMRLVEALITNDEKQIKVSRLAVAFESETGVAQLVELLQGGSIEERLELNSLYQKQYGMSIDAMLARRVQNLEMGKVLSFNSSAIALELEIARDLRRGQQVSQESLLKLVQNQAESLGARLGNELGKDHSDQTVCRMLRVEIQSLGRSTMRALGNRPEVRELVRVAAREAEISARFNSASKTLWELGFKEARLETMARAQPRSLEQARGRTENFMLSQREFFEAHSQLAGRLQEYYQQSKQHVHQMRRDADKIAADLKYSMDGLGTYTETFWRAIRADGNNWAPSSWDRKENQEVAFRTSEMMEFVRQAYSRRADESLQDGIEGDFSGDEETYALMMMRGTTKKSDCRVSGLTLQQEFKNYGPRVPATLLIQKVIERDLPTTRAIELRAALNAPEMVLEAQRILEKSTAQERASIRIAYQELFGKDYLQDVREHRRGDGLEIQGKQHGSSELLIQSLLESGALPDELVNDYSTRRHVEFGTRRAMAIHQDKGQQGDRLVLAMHDIEQEKTELQKRLSDFYARYQNLAQEHASLMNMQQLEARKVLLLEEARGIQEQLSVAEVREQTERRKKEIAELKADLSALRNANRDVFADGNFSKQFQIALDEVSLRIQEDAVKARDAVHKSFRAMRGGLTGWGTEKEPLCEALESMTPGQRELFKILYTEYKDNTNNRSIEQDLVGDLSGKEHERAFALLEGYQDRALAAEAAYVLGDQEINSVFEKIQHKAKGQADALALQLEPQDEKKREALAKILLCGVAVEQAGSIAEKYAKTPEGIAGLTEILHTGFAEPERQKFSKEFVSTYGARENFKSVEEAISRKYSGDEKLLVEAYWEYEKNPERVVAIQVHMELDDWFVNERVVAGFYEKLYEKDTGEWRERIARFERDYNELYENVDGTLRDKTRAELSGPAEAWAMALLDANKVLADAHKLEYAVAGAGTSDDLLKEVCLPEELESAYLKIDRAQDAANHEVSEQQKAELIEEHRKHYVAVLEQHGQLYSGSFEAAQQRIREDVNDVEAEVYVDMLATKEEGQADLTSAALVALALGEGWDGTDEDGARRYFGEGATREYYERLKAEWEANPNFAARHATLVDAVEAEIAQNEADLMLLELKGEPETLTEIMEYAECRHEISRRGWDSFHDLVTEQGKEVDSLMEEMRALRDEIVLDMRQGMEEGTRSQEMPADPVKLARLKKMMERMRSDTDSFIMQKNAIADAVANGAATVAVVGGTVVVTFTTAGMGTMVIAVAAGGALRMGTKTAMSGSSYLMSADAALDVGMTGVDLALMGGGAAAGRFVANRSASVLSKIVSTQKLPGRVIVGAIEGGTDGLVSSAGMALYDTATDDRSYTGGIGGFFEALGQNTVAYAGPGTVLGASMGAAFALKGRGYDPTGRTHEQPKPGPESGARHESAVQKVRDDLSPEIKRGIERASESAEVLARGSVETPKVSADANPGALKESPEMSLSRRLDRAARVKGGQQLVDASERAVERVSRRLRGVTVTDEVNQAAMQLGRAERDVLVAQATRRTQLFQSAKELISAPFGDTLNRLKESWRKLQLGIQAQGRVNAAKGARDSVRIDFDSTARIANRQAGMSRALGVSSIAPESAAAKLAGAESKVSDAWARIRTGAKNLIELRLPSAARNFGDGIRAVFVDGIGGFSGRLKLDGEVFQSRLQVTRQRTGAQIESRTAELRAAAGAKPDDVLQQRVVQTANGRAEFEFRTADARMRLSKAWEDLKGLRLVGAAKDGLAGAGEYLWKSRIASGYSRYRDYVLALREHDLLHGIKPRAAQLTPSGASVEFKTAATARAIADQSRAAAWDQFKLGLRDLTQVQGILKSPANLISGARKFAWNAVSEIGTRWNYGRASRAFHFDLHRLGTEAAIHGKAQEISSGASAQSRTSAARDVARTAEARVRVEYRTADAKFRMSHGIEQLKSGQLLYGLKETTAGALEYVRKLPAGRGYADVRENIEALMRRERGALLGRNSAKYAPEGVSEAHHTLGMRRAELDTARDLAAQRFKLGLRDMLHPRHIVDGIKNISLGAFEYTQNNLRGFPTRWRFDSQVLSTRLTELRNPGTDAVRVRRTQLTGGARAVDEVSSEFVSAANKLARSEIGAASPRVRWQQAVENFKQGDYLRAAWDGFASGIDLVRTRQFGSLHADRRAFKVANRKFDLVHGVEPRAASITPEGASAELASAAYKKALIDQQRKVALDQLKSGLESFLYPKQWAGAIKDTLQGAGRTFANTVTGIPLRWNYSSALLENSLAQAKNSTGAQIKRRMRELLPENFRVQDRAGSDLAASAAQRARTEIGSSGGRLRLEQGLQELKQGSILRGLYDTARGSGESFLQRTFGKSYQQFREFDLRYRSYQQAHGASARARSITPQGASVELSSASQAKAQVDVSRELGAARFKLGLNDLTHLRTLHKGLTNVLSGAGEYLWNTRALAGFWKQQNYTDLLFRHQAPARRAALQRELSAISVAPERARELTVRAANEARRVSTLSDGWQNVREGFSSLAYGRVGTSGKQILEGLGKIFENSNWLSATAGRTRQSYQSIRLQSDLWARALDNGFSRTHVRLAESQSVSAASSSRNGNEGFGGDSGGGGSSDPELPGPRRPSGMGEVPDSLPEDFGIETSGRDSVQRDLVDLQKQARLAEKQVRGLEARQDDLLSALSSADLSARKELNQQLGEVMQDLKKARARQQFFSDELQVASGQSRSSHFDDAIESSRTAGNPSQTPLDIATDSAAREVADLERQLSDLQQHHNESLKVANDLRAETQRIHSQHEAAKAKLSELNSRYERISSNSNPEESIVIPKNSGPSARGSSEGGVALAQKTGLLTEVGLNAEQAADLLIREMEQQALKEQLQAQIRSQLQTVDELAEQFDQMLARTSKGVNARVDAEQAISELQSKLDQARAQLGQQTSRIESNTPSNTQSSNEQHLARLEQQLGEMPQRINTAADSERAGIYQQGEQLELRINELRDIVAEEQSVSRSQARAHRLEAEIRAPHNQDQKLQRKLRQELDNAWLELHESEARLAKLEARSTEIQDGLNQLRQGRDSYIETHQNSPITEGRGAQHEDPAEAWKKGRNTAEWKSDSRPDWSGDEQIDYDFILPDSDQAISERLASEVNKPFNPAADRSNPYGSSGTGSRASIEAQSGQIAGRTIVHDPANSAGPHAMLEPQAQLKQSIVAVLERPAVMPEQVVEVAPPRIVEVEPRLQPKPHIAPASPAATPEIKPVLRPIPSLARAMVHEQSSEVQYHAEATPLESSSWLEESYSTRPLENVLRTRPKDPLRERDMGYGGNGFGDELNPGKTRPHLTPDMDYEGAIIEPLQPNEIEGGRKRWIRQVSAYCKREDEFSIFHDEEGYWIDQET